VSDIAKVRNIGISAHIDSGKTTLSERILYYTGRIHAMHEVRGKDGVGAKMDSMDLEREKGITIQSAATWCEWGEHNINLIDTPGHVDFTIEVERALRVLDGAVLVLCAVSGVQSQSITVDRQMKRWRVPRLAFVNKCDRSGANPDRVVAQLHEKLGHNAVALQMPLGLERDFAGVVDVVSQKAVYYEGADGDDLRTTDVPEPLREEAARRRHDIVARLADLDEAVADRFLADEPVGDDELRAAIRRATLDLKITPVFIGSAFRNKGVQALLDGIVSYLPSPDQRVNEAFDQRDAEKAVHLAADADKPFVGLAFKLEDGRYGQLTYVRVYQGRVRKGDTILNCNTGRRVKVPRLVRMHASEMHDVEEAVAGDICALFGVECASGETFSDGDQVVTMTSMHVPAAVIDLAVAPKDKAGAANFSKAIHRFTREDPTLRVKRDEESGQTILSGMGELHLEIYLERMRREYGCEVTSGKPEVAYRETITRRSDYAYTHKKQTGGSGQYAKIAGYIEPLPADAVEPFEFVDEVVGGTVPREFIPAVERGMRESVAKGPLIGFPVTGVRVVLDDGASHPVDSSEMAFRIAARAAFKEAMAGAGAIVMEPVMKVEATAPEEFQGAVVGQLNQRRGVIQTAEVHEGAATVVAEVPLNMMFGYSTDLRSATQGKGEFTMEFAKYQALPRADQEALVAEYRRRQLEK